jgi:hypothetical protein
MITIDVPLWAEHAAKRHGLAYYCGSDKGGGVYEGGVALWQGLRSDLLYILEGGVVTDVDRKIVRRAVHDLIDTISDRLSK